MKKKLKKKQFNNKLKISAPHTWMCETVGVSELEGSDQGRLRDPSFTQETEIKQCQSRNDFAPSLLQKVQDARMFLTPLPFFFFFKKINHGL